MKTEDKLCRLCEEPIDPKRLLVLPKTNICIQCAQKREDSGQAVRSMMDINPQITSWECIGVDQVIIRGDDV